MKVATKDRVAGLSYPIRDSEFGMDVAIASDVRQIDESTMSCWIPIADGNRRDGVGDLLEVEGIKTERHVLNPLVLFDHAKECKLPIAKAKSHDGEYTFAIDPLTKTAGLRAFFWQGNDRIPESTNKEQYDHAVLCEQLFHMYAEGFINGGSIGYQVIQARELPPDYERGTPKGMHLLSVLMLEGSLVVLPANMDTVAKALSIPVVCGKPLSPVLVKSLRPFTPKKVVRMGYEGKALGERDKKASYNADYKAKQSFDEWLGGKRSIYSEKEKNILEQEYLRGRQERKGKKKVEGESYFEVCPRDEEGHCLPKSDVVDKRKEAPVRTRERENDKETREDKEQESQKNLDVKVPLDENLNDSSVPPAKWKPGVGATKKLPAKKTKAADKPTKSGKPTHHVSVAWRNAGPKRVWSGTGMDQAKVAAGQAAASPSNRQVYIEEEGTGKRYSIKDLDTGTKELRKKYRTSKGLRRCLKKAVPGSSMVYVKTSTLGDARKFAESKGLKFHHMGSSKDGSERIKLIGNDDAMDEVAKSFGLLVGTSKKNAEGRRFVGTKKTKAMPDLAEVTENELDPTGEPDGDELTLSVDDATSSTEPYGAQVLRKLHDDFSMLMKEYDDLMGPLENEVVKQLLVKLLQGMEKNLTEYERAFEKSYPDIQGLVDTKELDEEEEIDDVEDEEIEETDAELGDVEEKNLDKKRRKRMDDPALPSDSVSDEREYDEPSADEVVEGMGIRGVRVPSKKKMKTLRGKYSVKSLCAKCKAMGKKVCQCSAKALDDSVNRQEDFNPQAINPDVYPDEAEGDLKELFGDQDKETIREAIAFLEKIGGPDSQFDENERKEAYHLSKNFAALAPMVGSAIGSYMAGGDKEMDETETKECKACREAAQWFEELSNTRDFGDRHREKSGAWHKVLKDLVEDEIEEFEDDENEEVEGVAIADEVLSNGDLGETVDAEVEEDEPGVETKTLSKRKGKTPSKVGSKTLDLVFASQQKEIAALTKRMEKVKALIG